MKSDNLSHTSKLDILDLMVQDLTSMEEDDKQVKLLDQLLKSISDASWRHKLVPRDFYKDGEYLIILRIEKIGCE